MDGLIEGRIVHYVLGEGPMEGEHRPAIVVKVWYPETGTCNLQVFCDSDASGSANDKLPPVMWATSVSYDANHAPYTWHWPEPA